MAFAAELQTRLNEQAVVVAKAGNVIGDFAVNLTISAAIFVAALWLSNQAAKAVRRGLTRLPKSAHDVTLQDFAGSLVRYGVMIIGVVAILRRLGVETTSIITVLGAASLAIGLALQGALTNVAAGVMILIFRPYRVGDFVMIAGKQGTVKKLDLFNTEASDVDGLKIVVPNGKAFGDVVTNYTDIPRRRIQLKFGIGYDDDIEHAVATVLAVAKDDARVLADPAPWCKPTDLADSTVVIELRCWTDVAGYWDTRFDVLKRVKLAFDREGISLPFPTQYSLTRIEAPPADEAALSASAGKAPAPPPNP